MKKTLTVLALSIVAACATMAPVLIPTEGPVMRQVSRVVERHDAYVTADASLSVEDRTEYLGQSSEARQLMLSMPNGVPASMLNPRLAPVLDRHDSYVQLDSSLDVLVRDTYLASTSGLRSLLTEAMWSRE